ncbi:hypothetical protein ACIBBE_37945 [Streptomyces sp. NPDC051644]|uniref:hypothetical protein n=1 Tax=Streptomyces sp. NPDC051644 TaxID=3365666 RepID=UPI00378837C7
MLSSLARGEVLGGLGSSAGQSGQVGSSGTGQELTEPTAVGLGYLEAVDGPCSFPVVGGYVNGVGVGDAGLVSDLHIGVSRGTRCAEGEKGFASRLQGIDHDSALPHEFCGQDQARCRIPRADVHAFGQLGALCQLLDGGAAGPPSSFARLLVVSSAGHERDFRRLAGFPRFDEVVGAGREVLFRCETFKGQPARRTVLVSTIEMTWSGYLCFTMCSATASPKPTANSRACMALYQRSGVRPLSVNLFHPE